jgi:hypothetical protein
MPRERRWQYRKLGNVEVEFRGDFNMKKEGGVSNV